MHVLKYHDILTYLCFSKIVDDNIKNTSTYTRYACHADPCRKIINYIVMIKCPGNTISCLSCVPTPRVNMKEKTLQKRLAADYETMTMTLLRAFPHLFQLSSDQQKMCQICAHMIMCMIIV